MKSVTSTVVAQRMAASEKFVVKALVMTGASGGASTAPEAAKTIDPFAEFAAQLIEPPIDLLTLAKLYGRNSELGPCIDAMEKNIDGFGHRFVLRIPEDTIEADPALKEAVREERTRLAHFFETAARGEARRISFTALRQRTRKDVESTGNGFWEVLRDRLARIVGVAHVPAYQVRLAHGDGTRIAVEVPWLATAADGTPETRTYTDYVRFRKFVQGSYHSRTSEARWFREFGDPRIMDNRSGRYISEEEQRNFENTGRSMPEDRKASELFHFALYAPWTPYGMPRFYGALLEALGARSAQEVNFFTLTNNNIPSLVMTVSNGRLTGETIDRVQEFIATHVQGRANYSQILLLEGESGEEGDETNRVKIDIKPLTDVQHTDALFTNYMEACNDAVRRSFRLPGIFVGRTAELNKSLSETSRRLADEQIFAPERAGFDEVMNLTFLVRLGILYHEYRSHTPNVTDNTELIMLLASAERTGGITPRRADRIIQDVFPDMKAVPLNSEKVDLDRPFSLTMAEAIKNRALPTEVNQQIAPVQSAVQPALLKADDGLDALLDLSDRWADEVRRRLAESP